jgi:PAS domain S-box-containing protein
VGRKPRREIIENDAAIRNGGTRKVRRAAADRRSDPGAPAGPRDRSSLLKEIEVLRNDLSEHRRLVLEFGRRTEELSQRYSDLFDFAPIGLVSLDEYGVVREVNAHASVLVGNQPHHLLERPLVASVYPDDRRLFLEHLRRCRAGEESVSSQLRLFHKNRESIAVVMISQRSRMEGSVTFRTVILDLRERLRLEQERLVAELESERLRTDEQIARRSNEAKDRFLAVLSHELRTPLTPILFALARLSKLQALPAAAQPLVDVIQRNLEIETQLIGDLLDMNRIARGKLTLSRETVDLHAVVRDAVNVLERSFDDRQVSLTTAFDARSSIVSGDAGRLRQVFWNLMANALKFTEPGGTIQVRSTNPDAATVAVAIQDSGIGMQPAHIDELFRPFEQSSRGDAALGGLGLGLTICKGIVEAHGGRIGATSEGPARGSTFEVRLHTLPPPLRRRELLTDSSRKQNSLRTSN